MNRFLFVVMAVVSLPVAAPAQDSHFNAKSRQELQAFFQNNCVECHGADLAEGELRLDSIPYTLDDAASLSRWSQIVERVTNGEMPPESATAPKPAELASFTNSAHSALRKHALANRKQEGRVVLRRMNRHEYQSTMRDLLGIETNLINWLPADASSHGFDNVSEALTVSPVLMERYYEAAKIALEDAIVTGKQPKVHKQRYLPKVNANRVGDKYELQGDAVIMFNGYYGVKFGGRNNFNAHADGLYRFRFTTFQHQSKGELVTLAIEAGNLIVKTGNTQQVGYFDVRPKGDTVIECDVRLEKGQCIAIRPMHLGNAYVKGTAKVTNHAIGIRYMDVEGPLHEQWPPRSQGMLFGELDIAKAGKADVEPVLNRFAHRAFRRRVTADEVAPFTALVHDRIDQGYSFEEAMRVGLNAILCSPDFLYLKETTGKLDDFELASRLSYFLWSSMPDMPLFQKAAKGELSQPDVLKSEVERMLQDPRSQRFTENFCGQWLNLRDMRETDPDGKLYPEYDGWLHESMIEESHRFFNEVRDSNLSVLNFIDSDFVIINRRLADHYGLLGLPTGQTDQFEKVQLPADSPRGGVMTQASVLKVTANGTNTSPILRGVWVMKNILGQEPPPPPPTVPGLEPDIRGATTIREELEKHRSLSSCNACHKNIDPPGFALEQFDPVGLQRDYYRTPTSGVGKRVGGRRYGVSLQYNVGPTVDSSGATAAGEEFSDVSQYKELLLKHPDMLAEAFARKVMIYATGGPLDFIAREEVKQIVADLSDEKIPFRSLIHAVVQSDTFQSK